MDDLSHPGGRECAGHPPLLLPARDERRHVGAQHPVALEVDPARRRIRRQLGPGVDEERRTAPLDDGGLAVAGAQALDRQAAGDALEERLMGVGQLGAAHEGGQPLDHGVGGALEDRGDEGLLALGEVAVDGRRGHAGLGDDLVHGGGTEPPAGEAGLGGVEDAGGLPVAVGLGDTGHDPSIGVALRAPESRPQRIPRPRGRPTAPQNEMLLVVRSPSQMYAVAANNNSRFL